MLLQRLHRQNFNPHIDLVTHIKRQVLDEQVVGHKGVFAELNLDRYAIFEKTSLRSMVH